MTTRTMTVENRRKAEDYFANMRRRGLKTDVRAVIDSIAKQYAETGWVSYKQLDALRRCMAFSNVPYAAGGFKGSPCFGRNAPAGRRQ